VSEDGKHEYREAMHRFMLASKAIRTARRQTQEATDGTR
jgi:hypothetical protein